MLLVIAYSCFTSAYYIAFSFPDGVPAFVLPSRPTDAQAFAPMQPLPAWTEVQSTQRETPVTPSLTAMPATVPALAAVQRLHR